MIELVGYSTQRTRYVCLSVHPYPQNLESERTAVYFPGEGVVGQRVELLQSLWDWLYHQFFFERANLSYYNAMIEGCFNHTGIKQDALTLLRGNRVFADPFLLLVPKTEAEITMVLTYEAMEALLGSIFAVERPMSELTDVLCELIDLALVIESGHELLSMMTRLTSLIEHYKSTVPHYTALLSTATRSADTTIDLRDTTPPRLPDASVANIATATTTANATTNTTNSTTAATSQNGVTILLDDDDDDDGDDDENNSITVNRCCEVHRQHCCCCERRRPGSSGGIERSYRNLFSEFVEFMEVRKRRKRRRVELNSKSSPIVISDSEESDANIDLVCLGSGTGEDQPPQPGPSRGFSESSNDATEANFGCLQEEIDTTTTAEAAAEAVVEESGHDVFPVVIERPQTASEFYSLLNSAFADQGDIREKTEEEDGEASSTPQASSSLQPPTVPLKSDSYEENEELESKPLLSGPARPLSAPAPLQTTHTNGVDPHV